MESSQTLIHIQTNPEALQIVPRGARAFVSPLEVSAAMRADEFVAELTFIYVTAVESAVSGNEVSCWTPTCVRAMSISTEITELAFVNSHPALIQI